MGQPIDDDDDDDDFGLLPFRRLNKKKRLYLFEWSN